MNNIVIREAEKKDIDNGLFDIYVEGYRLHQKNRPDIFVELSNEELLDDLTNIFSSYKPLIILNDDTIVGYAVYVIDRKLDNKLLLKMDHTLRNDITRLKILYFVIKESNRRKGYGTKLMNELINIAKNNNCNRVEFNCFGFNKDAIDFNKKMGFEIQKATYEMNL